MNNNAQWFEKRNGGYIISRIGGTISLCMIVCNEEENIRRCLDSVAEIVDEIIIVDTGSTDRTAEICRSYGAHIVEHKWNDNFSDARNAGLQLATCDWILVIDADEELMASSRDRLRSELSMAGETKLFHLHTIHYYGEVPDIEQTYRLEQLRLFRNHLGFRFAGEIHEVLQISDSITVTEQEAMTKLIDVQLLHYGYMKSEELGRKKNERNQRILEGAYKQQKADQQLNPWIVYHLASEYYRQRDFQKAFGLVNESIVGFVQKQQKPPSFTYILKYAIMIESGNSAGAWPGITRAIDIYPDYVDLHYYKGIILYETKRYEEAREAFLHCRTLGDVNLRYLSMQGANGYLAIYYEGLCLEKLGKLEEAKRKFHQVLNIYPGFTLAIESIDRLKQQS